MELNDWNGRGKDRLTTPGGSFRPPTGPGRSYEYGRTPTPRLDEPVKPAPVEPPPRTESASPFSRSGANQEWYRGVAPAPKTPAARSSAEAASAAQETAAAPVVVSHDGESGAGFVVEPPAPGGPQVYTIRLPAAPRQPQQKKPSLWWVAPLLLLALLLGFVLGALCGPMLTGQSSPARTEAPASTQSPASDPSPGGETAAARIYREYVGAVVGVMANPNDDLSSTRLPISVGTGFLISADGYVLTNAHVIGSAKSVTVTLSDGRQLPAIVKARNDESDDVALLKINAKELPCVQLGDSNELQVGDWVCTIGNPFGELNNSLTAGYYSAGPRQVDTGGKALTMLQINAAVNKGNSGGPLFNAAGQVVGIVTAKVSAPGTEPDAELLEGLGFALPITGILAWVREVSPQALD